MRRTMHEGDGIAVTLNGDTRDYGPGQARMTVDETSTRDGEKHRFLTVVVPLRDGEFPEDVAQHLVHVAES